MSQKAMAERMGVSDTTWQNYELGHSWPKTEVLYKLALEGVNANWVLTGAGAMLLSAESAAPNEGAANRALIWNVAFFLASDSPVINADPELFAETFADLCEYLDEAGVHKAGGPDAEKIATVINFAAKRLQSSGRAG